MGLKSSEHQPMTYNMGVFQRAYVDNEGRLWWELRYFFGKVLEGVRLLRIDTRRLQLPVCHVVCLNIRHAPRQAASAAEHA